VTGPRPTFLYDGDCAFCTSCARFIERWIHTRAAVLPWQFAGLEALGVTRQQAEEAVQWIDPGGSVASGSDAVAKLLADAGSYWQVAGFLLAHRPVRWMAGPVYRLVARNRGKLPGGTAACALPQAERDQLHRRAPG
jgi:predicted DCC family thiol-disulfide oxidoreductase YuxK